MTRNGEPLDQPVTEAINHPIGHVTQALINLWFKQNPNDNDLLPADITSLFTHLCDVSIDRFRHGRVLLAAHLIALFRVDSAWTERHLLPLLSWEKSNEARALWEGFLWSPRLFPPLMLKFKKEFLESAKHYAELGEHRKQYAAFLTYAALGPLQGYTAEEFRTAIESLPAEGLAQSARALSQALEGAGDKREDYWKNRVLPFWNDIWPKSRELASPQIADSLARLVLAAGTAFPAALQTTQDWLKPNEHPGYLVRRLHDSGLCQRSPAEALQFLHLLIADDVQWISSDLMKLLTAIVNSAPSLSRDVRYQRLHQIARRRGME